MMYDTWWLPARHGQIGALDEILIFCLPVVLAILILVLSARRSRSKADRVRRRGAPDPESGDEAKPGG